jgi:hypothetical protein
MLKNLVITVACLGATVFPGVSLGASGNGYGGGETTKVVAVPLTFDRGITGKDVDAAQRACFIGGSKMGAPSLVQTIYSQLFGGTINPDSDLMREVTNPYWHSVEKDGILDGRGNVSVWSEHSVTAATALSLLTKPENSDGLLVKGYVGSHTANVSKLYGKIAHMYINVRGDREFAVVADMPVSIEFDSKLRDLRYDEFGEEAGPGTRILKRMKLVVRSPELHFKNAKTGAETNLIIDLSDYVDCLKAELTSRGR